MCGSPSQLMLGRQFPGHRPVQGQAEGTGSPRIEEVEPGARKAKAPRIPRTEHQRGESYREIKMRQTREGPWGVKHGTSQCKGWPLRLGKEPPYGAGETNLRARTGVLICPPVVGSFVSPAVADTYSEVHCLSIGVKSALTESFLVLPGRLPAG